MAKLKLKSDSVNFVCQNKEQAVTAIAQIGEAQRGLVKLQTEINDITAAAIEQRQEKMEQLKNSINTLSQGVQIWCEANRSQLCQNGSKTANLTTGEISWRQKPPSVSLRGTGQVLEALKKAQLNQFIRVKEEVNKDAILAEPHKVQGIKGITVVSGLENFIISPFAVETE